jgi:ankyrin repeat protein
MGIMGRPIATINAKKEFVAAAENLKAGIFEALESGDVGAFNRMRHLWQNDKVQSALAQSGIKLVDENGNTPAHYAATSGRMDMLLAVKMANLSWMDKNNDRKTPSKVAQEAGHMNIVTAIHGWMKEEKARVAEAGVSCDVTSQPGMVRSEQKINKEALAVLEAAAA